MYHARVKYLAAQQNSEHTLRHLQRMEREIDSWIGSVAAVMWSMYWSVVMTKWIKSQIQMAKMFLRRVVGRSP